MIADSFTSAFYEYIDGVLSDEIVACELVKRACERHQRDIERQSTQEFPYHFCTKTAAKVCRFYPKILRHSIGRYQGLPFELEPWQIFVEGSLFGWLRDADELRRFRTSYESVARKNGKSTRAAGRALYMAGYDGNPVLAGRLGRNYAQESVAQVILAAQKREQADKVVYQEILRMRQRSPSITKSSKAINRQVEFLTNRGTIQTVGSDKPFDGLNPHMVVMDELHAWGQYQRDFHDTMITGGASRDQPLISYITTAGDNKSEIWNEVYDYARSVLLGTVEDESYFAFVCELDETDDPFDPAVWLKSNPNLGVSVSQEYLEQQARKMQTTAVGRNRFMRYHGNRRVNSVSSAFDLALWDKCKGPFSDWEQADAIAAGVDLGGRDDLAAYAVVARFPVGVENVDDGEGERTLYRYEVSVRCYIAENTKRDLTKQPFAQFIHDGQLTVCKYPIQQLQDDLLEECQTLRIRTLGYDPFNAQQFGESCGAKGLVAAKVMQTHAMYTEPIHQLLKCIEDRLLVHDGDPLLRWCASNAMTIENSKEQIMFDRKESSDKIDPIVAMTMAFRVCSLAPSSATGSLFVR